MTSGSITSWKTEGEKVGIVTYFIFVSSKITVDGDFSHEIKRCLIFGRKVMTNLDSILKSRDVNLSTKVHLIKTMVFPVIMYRCKNWIRKEVEQWRIDAFKLLCWKRLLRVHWTARSSNQSILKKFSPEYYFGHPLGKDHDAGKDWRWEEKRMTGWDGCMASPTQWTWVWVNSGSWWRTGKPGVLQSMWSQRVGHNWVTELNYIRKISVKIAFLKFWYLNQ